MWFFRKRKQNPLPPSLIREIIKGTNMLKVSLRDSDDMSSVMADAVVAGYTMSCKPQFEGVRLHDCDVAYHRSSGLLLIIPPSEKDLAEVFINIDDSGWEYLELDHRVCEP